LNAEEMVRVADEIIRRLSFTKSKAYFMLPMKGVGRYSIPGGVLEDKEADEAFFTHLKNNLPENIVVVERDLAAEDPAFVREAVDKLIELIENP
jgi:uncharacterized protein (UPF0261 family)